MYLCPNENNEEKDKEHQYDSENCSVVGKVKVRKIEVEVDIVLRFKESRPEACQVVRGALSADRNIVNIRDLELFSKLTAQRINYLNCLQ